MSYEYDMGGGIRYDSEEYKKGILKQDGGPGSGNWGHVGVPGKRGGSAKSGLGGSEVVSSIQKEKSKKGIDASSEEYKNKQLDIIQKTNPMEDDYHTGIRSVEDIKTFKEAVEDEPPGYPDVTDDLIERAMDTGEITIYSSYPIEQGTFITPSQIQANEYAGNQWISGDKFSGGGKVYSKTIKLEEVAWINGDEGQFTGIV